MRSSGIPTLSPSTTAHVELPVALQTDEPDLGRVSRQLAELQARLKVQTGVHEKLLGEMEIMVQKAKKRVVENPWQRKCPAAGRPPWSNNLSTPPLVFHIIDCVAVWCYTHNFVAAWFAWRTAH